MKICSFNINGLRARLHQLQVVMQRYDLVGLQEIKVDDSQFPMDAVLQHCQSAVHHGQKGHYGVANLAHALPVAQQTGFAWREPDAQKRFVQSEYLTDKGPLTLLNGYFPQGDNRKHDTKFPAKEQFYADLLQHIQQLPTDSLYVLVGDMNVAHQDLDIGIGEVNRKRWLSAGKCAFLPEERQWLQRLLSLGLVDAFRSRYPDQQALSWFDYRSRAFEDQPKRGLRIDYLLVSPALAPLLLDAGIDLDIRAMEKPSDHAPVWAELDIAFLS